MSAFGDLNDDDEIPAEDLDLTMEAEDFVPESVCHTCGAVFGPDGTGHCSPLTGGCCQTFASNHAFDRHRTGRFEPDTGRCLTVAEMTSRGWTRSGQYDAWRIPSQGTPWKAK